MPWRRGTATRVPGRGRGNRRQRTRSRGGQPAASPGGLYLDTKETAGSPFTIHAPRAAGDRRGNPPWLPDSTHAPEHKLFRNQRPLLHPLLRSRLSKASPRFEMLPEVVCGWQVVSPWLKKLLEKQIRFLLHSAASPNVFHAVIRKLLRCRGARWGGIQPTARVGCRALDGPLTLSAPPEVCGGRG